MNGEKTDVSIVVPAYNAAVYLPDCLESVFAQTRQPLEVLVIDDGSDDDTAVIAQSYGKRVRYFRIPHCGFPGTVRNYGLERIQGEYVAFLDADDYLLPDSLRRRLDVLTTNPKIGFVYGNYYLLREKETAVAFTDEQGLPCGWVFDELFQYNFIHTSSVLARRSLVQESGGFHPHVDVAEDYWLWLQMARRAPTMFVSEPLSVYRQRAGSLSRLGVMKKLPHLIRVVEDIAKEFQLSSLAIDQRMIPLKLWLAKECLRNGKLWSALRWSAPVLLRHPGELIKAVAFMKVQLCGART